MHSHHWYVMLNSVFAQYTTLTACLASSANFIYGRVLAKVLSHVTIMPVLLRPVNNFLGQVIGNASEGKYNTVNNSSSGEVTFQKCLNSGISLFSPKNSNKSQTFATGAYQRLYEARPRRVVWLWEPEYLTASVINIFLIIYSWVRCLIQTSCLPDHAGQSERGGLLDPLRHCWGSG